MIVNKNNINSVLNSPGLLVLFFSNPTCGPCNDVKISLNAAIRTNPCGIGYVNTHADEEVPKRYGVKTTPVLVFIKQNREVGRIVGSTTPAKIVSIIKANV